MTVVYVLISSERDLYYEQLLISLYSLRLHNPYLDAVVLVDDVTNVTLTGKRAAIHDYADVRVIDVPAEYTPRERSRYIKTTFRHHLTGDLLFIDTDTVITGSLSDVATIEADVAAVLDFHSHLDKQIDGSSIVSRIKFLFDYDITTETEYYNSGVMFIRDTPAAHELFDKWHHFWQHAAFVKHECYDQPALLMADIKCNNVIQELDGTYNCQVLTSIQYLHHARIIHFFNNEWDGKEQFSPFFKKNLYLEIKHDGDISECTKSLVADCKSAFYSPNYYVCPDNIRFNQTIVAKTIYSLYKKNSLTYRLLRSLCNLRANFARLKSR